MSILEPRYSIIALALSCSGCLLPRSGLVGDTGCEASPELCRDAGCEASPELCNGVDDDCDPSTADGADEPTLGSACDAEDDDLCEDETIVCQDGGLICVGDGVGNVEVCGGGDEDCDGEIDENGTPFFLDGDGDGYGAGTPVVTCAPPAMHVAMDGDCDDASATVSPDAAEVCDGRDQNCDGSPDDAVCGCPSVGIAGRAYLLCSGATHWSGAAAQCRAVGYDLAKIEDADESAAVAAALSAPAQWWIGLLHSAGRWGWTDGSAVGTELWAAGEGSATAGEGCGALIDTGQWADRTCGTTLPYVCER